jgi:hypothetical protein
MTQSGHELISAATWCCVVSDRSTGPDEYDLAKLYGGRREDQMADKLAVAVPISEKDEAANRAASVDAFEIGLSPKYPLLLDFDDEAGCGLLRLVALSIEGLPGGRLEER